MPKPKFRWSDNCEGANLIQSKLIDGEINEDTNYMSIYNDYNHLWMGMKADTFRRQYLKLVTNHVNKSEVRAGKYNFCHF